MKKLSQGSSLRRALGIATGLVTGFVAGFPIVLAASDLLPIISIGSPMQNQTVGGNVTVSAVSDSTGVVGLQFKIDGQNLGSEITSGSCRAMWDSTQTTDGLHTIQAAGRDQYGNMTLAQPVTVLVSNPPYSAPTPSPSPSPSPEPSPIPTLTPVPQPTPEPTWAPEPAPAPEPTSVGVLSITAPLGGAALSGSAVPIVATFPSGTRNLSYYLRDVATGVTRWSATGPNLSTSATSSSFTADLSAVPAGNYNLVVWCQRSEGPTLAADVRVSIGTTTLSTALTVTGGRDFVATASLKLHGVAVPGVRVLFIVTNPLGVARYYDANTDSNGVATLKGRLFGSDPRGTYLVRTSASASGVTSTAIGSFVY